MSQINRKARYDFLKKDVLIQQLVNSYGNWVRTDCENRAGGTGRMTKELYPYTAMFSPIQINKLTVKNRLVMAPMGNCQMAEETGRPNDKMQVRALGSLQTSLAENSISLSI